MLCWGICQQSETTSMDQLLSQVEMDFVASVPDGNVPTEPIPSAAPTPPPVAYSKAPARKERSGLLRDFNPKQLLDTMIFCNGLYFALRSGQEHQ